MAFRNEQGIASVLEDRCAHRGAPLSEGKVCGNSLQCPYHGWEYNPKGQLINVPALQNNRDSWTGVAIRAYQTAEQQGFIWIFESPAITPHPPPLFPHYKEKGWSNFVMQTKFTATVDSCLENFLDCPHATYVHRYWFRSPTKKIVKADVQTLCDGAEAVYHEEPREKSLVWWLFSPRKGTMHHTDRFITPNTSRVDYQFPGGMHYIITSSCTPINARETMVHTVMTFRYKRIGFLIRLFLEPLSRLIIRQDVAMLAHQQNNMEQSATPESREFQSTEADLLGPHIIAWRKSMLNGTNPPAAGQIFHVEIQL